MKIISKILFIFVFILFLPQFSVIQVYAGWFKHYGGSSKDHGYSIQQTSDGGYIFAGDTDSFSHGMYDFAIYKINSSGNKTWFKHYGGSNVDSAKSVQQISDGDFVVAGNSDSYTYGSADFAVYKLDSNGDK